MYWYYVEGGRQVGPLTEQDFQERLRQGRIGMEIPGVGTSKCRHGKRMGPSSRPPVQAPAARPAACSQCGRQYSQQDMIHYENQFICANCKPLFFNA